MLMSTKKTPAPTEESPVQELAAEGQVVGFGAGGAGGFGTTKKQQFADYAMGGTLPAAATANLYFALAIDAYTAGTTDVAAANGTFTEPPTAAASGNWTNYARVMVANNTTNFAAATNPSGATASKTNATAVVFTTNAQINTVANGPVPTMVVILNDPTAKLAANVIAVGVISPAATAVANGSTVQCAAGSITFALV